jgi:hypothetical protein
MFQVREALEKLHGFCRMPGFFSRKHHHRENWARSLLLDQGTEWRSNLVHTWKENSSMGFPQNWRKINEVSLKEQKNKLSL